MDKKLTDLKKDSGYGGIIFNEFLTEVEDFKKKSIELATNLYEGGYYEEAEAIKKLDWNELLKM